MGIQINGQTDTVTTTTAGGSVKVTPLSASTGLNVGTGASISSPATNVLTLGTNNTEVIRVGATGLVGIRTTNPLSILQVQVPNNISSYVSGTTPQGLYVANSSGGFIYPSTSSFQVNPGIYNNLTLDTSQTINSTTPGGFNYITGIKNQLNLSASSTSTDLTRLYIYAIESNVGWTTTAPTTQIIGLSDSITFGGSSISVGQCQGSFALSGISSSTQTATTIRSSGLSIFNLTQTNTIRNVTTWRGYNSNLNIGQGTGAGNTTTITTAEHFSNTSSIISAGGSGSVTNITNLYGLRLGTPTSSGTVNITNNWGVYQEWSRQSNYFAGNVLVGSATSTGTASQPLQVTGGAYVSGNVGINSTAPRTALDVGGELILGRVDASQEGGQVSLCRSSDNASAWAVDVFGSTSTPSLRFIDNVAAVTRMSIDGSGNFAFNSGYGSAATVYGVRAWVRKNSGFDGSGNAIMGSANVTSLTQQATGRWTVNLTNAMPDTNYAVVATSFRNNSDSFENEDPTVRSTTTFTICLMNYSGSRYDFGFSAAVIR